MTRSTPPRYHPDLEPFLTKAQNTRRALPSLAPHDIEGRRRMKDVLLQGLPKAPLHSIVHRQIFQTTTLDNHTLSMTWYSPTATRPSKSTSAILHFHGGGLIMFSVHDFHAILSRTVALTDVPILSVDYRLAPEHPFPTPLDDCYTALTWLRAHAGSLNVDIARIGVMGESAGGCLAAALTLLDRDRNRRGSGGGSPPLAKQILVYPMLDNRNTMPSSEDETRLLGPLLSHTWEDNVTNWSAYLGRDENEDEKGNGSLETVVTVSKYAAPARESDMAGLPPAFIDVGELDIFLREDVDYADRLRAAGVGVDLHVYPGAPHAFEILVAEAEISKFAVSNRVAAITSF